MNTILLDPFDSELLGRLKNRIAMSAMARGCADNKHCCTKSLADYYVRRAENGVALILTGGMVIHPSGDGYNNVPHIWDRDHANSWKSPIKRIHKSGSKIFSQLWHCGRISHSDFTGGIQPVSSSDKQAEGINRQNNKPFSTPRPLKANEIPEVYGLYLNAVYHAMKAGFDGVELHMGHGYLVDQFFDSRINDRTDKYGGSIENRCRFALELIKAVLQKISPKQLMIRISPSREMGGLYDWPDMEEMLNYLVPALDRVGLRLLDVSCARSDYSQTSSRVVRLIRPMWKHFIMAGASLSHEQANKEIDSEQLDMVTWGRYILANPDFVSRLRKDGKLDLLPDRPLRDIG